MKIYSDTNIGLKRIENQDRVRTFCFADDVNFVVICDGMGGENAGSEASQKAIDVVFDRVTKIYKQSFDTNQTRNLLLSAVITANAVVHDFAISSESMKGMGTTCVCALQNKKMLYVVSVGDSRAYLAYKDTITQITKDHTIVMQMYDNGEITMDELKCHPQRNYITRAVGVAENVNADYFEVEIQPKSTILLCSDGLTGNCDDSDILKVINEYDDNKIAGKLIEEALLKGGSDNITVAIIK